MQKLSDYVAKKEAAKKAGFDTNLLKDDFKSKFTKMEAADEKAATAQKEHYAATGEVLKTIAAYRKVIMKFENENFKDKSKKDVVEAVGAIGVWLGKLEQELLVGR